MLAFMLTLLKFVFNIKLVLTDCISSTMRASPGRSGGEHNTSIVLWTSQCFLSLATRMCTITVF